ncbi:hypothetical protein CsSME_00008104 [Camellia sinensis var. sinensis]
MDLILSCPFHLFMHLVLFFSLSSGFPHVAAHSPHAGNETDKLALLAFKAATTGNPYEALTSWNASIHFCQWVGVTCGRQHQRVIALNLHDQKLTGSISPHIGNLSFLRELQLSNNSLSHKIPPELGRLQRLQMLSLSNNSITGEIPTNISACHNLFTLELSLNKLAGKIHMELGSLSKLEKFSFRRNNLVGEVPSTFGNLSSLQKLIAAGNGISGNIPDALGRLTNLQVLALEVNRLVGTLPYSIFNLSSMVALNVAVNQLRGRLPSDLGVTFTNLEFLGLTENLFTGYIPISISNASKIQRLCIDGNKFTGKVPPLEKLHDLQWLCFEDNQLGTGEVGDLGFLSSLTNATNLVYVGLRNNSFGGKLPESVSNFSMNLNKLLLDNNKIFGSIPTGIGNLVKLQQIELWENQFTGNIPTDIGKLQELQIFRLSNNKFSGNIPSSLGNLSLLSKLGLSGNNFYGRIPSSLGKCQILEELNLERNNFSGTITREVMSISSLLHLNLSQNHLTGFLPVEIGNLKNLEVLDVSDNMLSGEIPSRIGTCVKLRLLCMKGNNFQGILPSSLSYLRGMEEIDLSVNNFSGKVPEYLESFSFLQKLNLSLNDFEGAIPESGIFMNATAVFVKGNPKLCGGIPELQLHSCNSRGSTLNLNLIIPTIFGLLGLILMLCFLYLGWFQKRAKMPYSNFLGNTFLKLSYESLVKATDGFSPNNLIGVGSFGSVYKAILDQGGKAVAVKVLHLQFHGASKSFIAECETMKCIKHRNLVKLLTTCSSVDHHGNDFKALIYEFMVNGSLEKWLHPIKNEDEAQEDSRALNLLQRLNIAIDVASALDYLHHHCLEPIIHCDLKPSNVLLDKEMIGHVGDFGLARFLPEATYHSFANQSSSIGIIGSVGYAAPEYGMGNEVSTSGDVYSYGILLLEILTGKKPTDDMFNGSLCLHNFAKMVFSEQVVSVVDPTLIQQIEKGDANLNINNAHNQSSDSSHKIQECIVSILKVGIACSQELPRDRPTINDVVTRLHVIKDTLLGTGGVHGGIKLELRCHIE